MRRHWLHHEPAAKIVTELDGWIELGHARQALLSARLLLKQPLDGQQFAKAIEAVLIHANRLKPWREKIESAFQHLKPQARQSSRSPMFQFYVALSDWKAAARFLPRNPRRPDELLFAMWTLVNLGELIPLSRLPESAGELWSNMRSGGNRTTIKA